MPHRQHIQHLVSFVLDKLLSSQLSSNHAFNYLFFVDGKTSVYHSVLAFRHLSSPQSLPTLLIDVLSKVNVVQWTMENIQLWIAGIVHNLIRSWKPAIALSDNPANVYGVAFYEFDCAELSGMHLLVRTPEQHTIWPELANENFGHLEIHERDAVAPFQKSYGV